VERFHETDSYARPDHPGASKVSRTATEKNNPFTEFGDTCMRRAGQRKLADILKWDRKQRADAMIRIGN